MKVRRGGPGDAGAVLALFDEAVAWLVARGQTGQWGSEPTSRNEQMVARERIGALLIAHAVGLARDAGVPLLRVDCWAGAPKLVGFYEAQGFVRDGTFDLRGWIGQVFSMHLGHQPGTASR